MTRSTEEEPRGMKLVVWHSLSYIFLLPSVEGKTPTHISDDIQHLTLPYIQGERLPVILKVYICSILIEPQVINW